MREKLSDPPTVTILGAGSIGVSFAAVFSDAGALVHVVEPDSPRRQAVPQDLADQRDAISNAGLSHNGAGQVVVTDQLDDQLSASDLILECGPEDLAIKQAIFADLVIRSSPQTVLATASSAITMSQILPDPKSQRRCLVAHPVNPPAVLRVIELVPCPGTEPDATDQAFALFEFAGFTAVLLGHEIEGFLLNRLQGAVLREAYRLVDEGVADVAGIDAIVRMGLGPRWALSGPFETAELNTPGGIKAHAARMGPAYKRMGEARGETVDWSSALIEEVDAQRRATLSAVDLPNRVKWRSDAVAKLVAARDKLVQD